MSSLPLSRVLGVLAMIIIGALAAIASPASASPRTTEYELPARNALPSDLTTGPDGAMWVTDGGLGRIWRISATGRIRGYDLGQQPGGVAVADGSMWVADAGGNAIHRVETDGSSHAYPLAPGTFPIGIARGADGALWFTEGRGDAIGRITTAGDVTEYPLPTAGAFATDIQPGPDGALYFSEESAGQIGRITLTGAITEYALPGAGALPGQIVSVDGALYVADRNNNTIDRMTTGGAFTDTFELPRENADPLAMVLGADGAIYISEFMTGVVSRMTTDGTFTKKFRIPGGFPDSIANGPDGALWVGRGSDGTVVRLDAGLDAPVTAHGTTFDARVGVAAKHTVAAFTDADPNARPRDYEVTISWGDGSSSAGWVRRSGGGFAVRGAHTYAKKGTRKVVVRVTDGVGKGLDAKVVSTANVAE